MTALPRQTDDWTVDDLARLPDDGLQYELLDGMVLVTPAPIVNHQRRLGGVYRLLHAACPTDRYEVFMAPLDWQPDRRTSLQPDVLVIAVDKLGEKNITEVLALAVEVLSPSTRRKDLILKRSKYEEVGVPSYWVVDPIVPSVTVWELRDRAYVEVGTVSGDETLEVSLPFPVTITPSRLR